MSVNLYDIMNVPQNCTKNDIKRSYRKLLKEFHPDQPTGNTEMFELIVHSYNVLINDKSREEYDKLTKLESQSESDHFKFRDNAKKYVETQSLNVLNKTDKEAKKDYEASYKNMDLKHKFNRSAMEEIANDEAVRRFDDILLARKQDDYENETENEGMFTCDPNNMDMALFNEVWDKTHVQTSELTKYSEVPYAWNNTDGSSNYGDVNNYEDLYDDKNFDGSCEYGSINFGTHNNSHLTKDDIVKLKGTNYTNDHNKKDANYAKTLDEKIKERQLETDRYHDKNFKDFDTDNSCGGYGIFSKVGNNTLNSITWDNNEDLSKKCKSLMEHRNKK